MASFSTNMDNVKDLIYIGIDFGTVYSAISFKKFAVIDGKPDVDPGLLKPNNLKDVASDGHPQVRTQIAWHVRKEKMLCGEEVDRAIVNFENKDLKVFEFPKLGIDDTKYTQSQRNNLQQKLSELPDTCDTRSVESLIELFLRHLFKTTTKAMKAAGITYGGEDLSLPQDASIISVVCVPAMWPFKIRQSFKDIATRAGIPNVELMAEPDAAATLVIYGELKPYARDQDRVAEDINSQGPMLVVDIGGGTGVSLPSRLVSMRVAMLTYFSRTLRRSLIGPREYFGAGIKVLLLQV